MAEPAVNPSISVCNACGKLFPRVYVMLCTPCSLIEENRFGLVRDYLRDHDGASIAEIADATGLSRGDVARFQSDGRLVALTSPPQDTCSCTPGGARCAYCRRQLAQKFQEAAREQKQPPEPTEPVKYVRRIHRLAEE